MRGVRVVVTAVALCCASAFTRDAAAAQDLFELEVFEYETTPPGRYDVELHTNVMSRGAVTPASAVGNHRPAHVSMEVARGWTERFETAVFIQTAPFGSAGSDRFAGGHLRAKFRLGEFAAFPLRIAASTEYTFNRAAFDRELQTLEIRPILDYARGRLSLIANPSVELVTRGADAGLEPVFDVSARAGWPIARAVTLTGDYFSATATTRHLRPEPAAHHLLFAGVDLAVAPRWQLHASAGHCVTSAEPWVIRSVMGFTF